MKFWEKVKEAFKPVAETLDTEDNIEKLKSTVYTLLDQNGDGQLSIDDFFFCVRTKLDKNKNDKVDFWEIIGAFFAIRKLLKQYKKEA